jgi:hypothetical protein
VVADEAVVTDEAVVGDPVVGDPVVGVPVVGEPVVGVPVVGEPVVGDDVGCEVTGQVGWAKVTVVWGRVPAVEAMVVVVRRVVVFGLRRVVGATAGAAAVVGVGATAVGATAGTVFGTVAAVAPVVGVVVGGVVGVVAAVDVEPDTDELVAVSFPAGPEPLANTTKATTSPTSATNARINKPRLRRSALAVWPAGTNPTGRLPAELVTAGRTTRGTGGKAAFGDRSSRRGKIGLSCGTPSRARFRWVTGGPNSARPSEARESRRSMTSPKRALPAGATGAATAGTSPKRLRVARAATVCVGRTDGADGALEQRCSSRSTEARVSASVTLSGGVLVESSIMGGSAT